MKLSSKRQKSCVFFLNVLCIADGSLKSLCCGASCFGRQMSYSSAMRISLLLLGVLFTFGYLRVSDLQEELTPHNKSTIERINTKSPAKKDYKKAQRKLMWKEAVAEMTCLFFGSQSCDNRPSESEKLLNERLRK